VPCAQKHNGSPPDFGLCREHWTRRESATSRHRSIMHHENQWDGSNTHNSSLKLCVKDKWIKPEPRTLDLEWRDSAVPSLKCGLKWCIPGEPYGS